MSIATASRFAIDAENKEARVAGDSAGEKVSAAIQQLTAYIPAEALGIYVALIGLFQEQGKRTSWIIFGVGIAALLLFVWLTYQPLDRATETRTRNCIWLNLFALVSFVAYSAALPASPFSRWGDNAGKIGAGAAIVLAPLIPAVAKKLGLRLAGQK